MVKSQVSATFIGGVLKPDEILPLPEYARVHLTVEQIGESSKASAAWSALKQRIEQRPIRSTKRHFTRDELHERR